MENDSSGEEVNEKDMNNRNVNKGVIYNTIKTVMGIIYPLITFPYVSRVLMTVNVGKINFSISIVSYFSLIASLGISTYAVRECSKVRDNKEKLEKTVGQIFSINILSTLLAYAALAVTLVFARPLDNYRLLICIQSATILFTTFGADWLNTAMEDFKFIAIRTIAMQVVSLLLLFVFVHNPDDYIIYAIIIVVASSGASIINIYYRRRFCKTRFTFNIDWKKHFPPILLLFSMILMQTIYCNSDMTMLGLIKGDFEVGLYSTSVKIYTMVNQVVASIAFVLMPQLSESFSKADYQRINELLRYGLSFIVTLGLPCLVGLNVIATPIIGTIGGNEYLAANVSLHILTLSLACSFIGGLIANMTLLPSGKESVCLKSGIVSALLNIVLNLFFIPLWGLNGAAFTTFLSELVGLIIVSRFVDRQVKIANVLDVLKAPVIGSVLIAIVGLIISNLLSSYIAITVVTIAISVCVYAAVLVAFKNEFFMGYATPIINRIKGVLKK